MNTLSFEKKVSVLSMLVEGNSVRSIERVTGVHRDTILRLMVGVGQKCEKVLCKGIFLWVCKLVCNQKNHYFSSSPSGSGVNGFGSEGIWPGKYAVSILLSLNSIGLSIICSSAVNCKRFGSKIKSKIIVITIPANKTFRRIIEYDGNSMVLDL